MTALFLRDIRLGIRAGGGALVGVLFFLAVVTVVPFAVGPDLNLLARIGRFKSNAAALIPLQTHRQELPLRVGGADLLEHFHGTPGRRLGLGELRPGR